MASDSTDGTDRPRVPRPITVSVEWQEERRASDPRVRRLTALIAAALAVAAAVVLTSLPATNHRGTPLSISGVPSRCLHSASQRVFVGDRPPYTAVTMQVPNCP